MSKSQLSLPKLRFKQYSNCYLESKLINHFINDKFEKEFNSSYFYDAPSIISKKPIIFSGQENKKADKDSIIFIKDGSSAGNFQYVNDYFFIASTCDYIKTSLVNKFIFYLLVSKKNYISSKLLIGETIPHLYKKDLLNIKIWYPNNMNEQEKIANFFSLLDKHISLWERKLQLYLLKKNFYLDGILKIDKKIFPRLKFKNSCISFKKRKLGEICEILKGDQINNSYLINNGKYYYLNGGIYPSGYINDWNRCENTISISEGGESCGYCKWNDRKFWAGGHLFTLEKINKMLDKKFLFYFLKSIEKIIRNLRVGGALPNIQKKDLSNIIIVFPNLIEQEKIANFFTLIDKNIDFITEWIKKLKLQKTYFLNKLFI